MRLAIDLAYHCSFRDDPALTLSLGPCGSHGLPTSFTPLSLDHTHHFTCIYLAWSSIVWLSIVLSVPLPLLSSRSGVRPSPHIRVLQCTILGPSPSEHKFGFDIREQGTPNHPVGRPIHRSALELDIVIQDAISEDGLQFTGCEETTRAIHSIRHRQQDRDGSSHTRHGDHVRKQWCRGTVQPFGA